MGSQEGKAGTTEGASAAELAAAIGLHRRGQLEQAERIYLAALEADPDNVQALHYLGVMRHQQGRSYLALQLVSRAIKLRPDYLDAINNLGNIYRQMGAGVEAVVAYQRVLELRPDHPDALHNLGIAQRTLEQYGDSVERYERAIELEPENVDNYYALAQAYKHVARYEEVLATLKKALDIKPDADGYRWYGHLLYAVGRYAEAAANYEAWLRFEPRNPVATHMLAACSHKDVPARADDAYVVNVFDRFAESFDEVLTRRLEYRAPGLVGEALKRSDGEPRGQLDIVDAGCGTGLLAQHLRPYARRLVGVDLSPKMLEKAAGRAAYDELVLAELASFLRASKAAFDVVASSDTLVYFGDLSEVLAAAHTALRPGGRLVFTLEHALREETASGGYRIEPHGRYTHSEAYVRGAVAEAGFDVIDIEKAHLRRQGGAYVAGLVVSARGR